MDRKGLRVGAYSGRQELMEKVRNFSWEAVEDNIFRQMSDTQTPQGVLTVLKQPTYNIEEILKEQNPLFMVLEDLQDPGNAGTIIRTGEGAGVKAVFLTKTCVDITNPKVIVQQWVLFTEYLFSTLKMWYH